MLRALVFLNVLQLFAGFVTATAQSPPPGGFVEPATSTSVRSRVIPALPNRGAFTFPAPYNTTGIRVTNDCGNTDCVVDVGYSYWRNMNNHVGSDTILLACADDTGAVAETDEANNCLGSLTEVVVIR